MLRSCFGLFSTLRGQNLVPLPPAMITAYIVFTPPSAKGLDQYTDSSAICHFSFHISHLSLSLRPHQPSPVIAKLWQNRHPVDDCLLSNGQPTTDYQHSQPGKNFTENFQVCYSKAFAYPCSKRARTELHLRSWIFRPLLANEKFACGGTLSSTYFSHRGTATKG